MIRAYLDETGQHENDYVIVAGHIGYESQWRRFIPEWRAALGSQRQRLHMNNIRWTRSTEKLLARLGPIPAQAGLKRLIGGVRVSDYEDLIPGARAQKVVNGYICALISTAVSLLLCNVPDGERFELVFEQQDRYAVMGHIALAGLMNDPDPHLRTKEGQSKLARWTYVPKDSTMLLDQADFLCYALLQRLRDRSSQRANWCAPVLDSDTETIGRIMTRDEIRDAVKREPFPGSNLL
jgi:hypothetical protein